MIKTFVVISGTLLGMSYAHQTDTIVLVALSLIPNVMNAFMLVIRCRMSFIDFVILQEYGFLVGIYVFNVHFIEAIILHWFTLAFITAGCLYYSTVRLI